MEEEEEADRGGSDTFWLVLWSVPMLSFPKKVLKPLHISYPGPGKKFWLLSAIMTS
jgi:hypothetical protein